MSDSESNEGRVVDPDEIQIPKEIAERLNSLIDAGRVVMMVGDEKNVHPMPLPAIFQEMFSILGDIDRRLTKLETGGVRPSSIIVPN